MKRHYYFKRGFIVLISMLMLSVAAVSNAEEITLTTYYPSPYGVYSEMRLYPKNSPTACSSTQKGLMYYDATDNKLKICNGTPPYQDIGGGYWTASPFNSNNIYNTNSGNVGIGTNNPLPSPGVPGVERVMHIYNPNSTGVGLRLQSTGIDGGIAIGSVGSVGIGLGTASYHALQFFTSTLERMRIAADGNVGIGTTSPASTERLHVNGGIYTPTWLKAGNLTVVNSALSAWNVNGVVGIGFNNGYSVGLGQNTGGETGLGISASGPTPAGTFYINPTVNEVRLKAYYGRSFNFLTSGGVVPDYSRLFIRNSDGFVGIGMTNPVVKLHVMGNMGCQFPGSGVYGDYFFVNQEAGRPVVRITDDGSYNPVLQFGKGNSWMNLEYYGSYLGIYGNAGNTVLISAIAVGGAYPGYSAPYPYETIGMQPTTNLRVNFGSVQKYVFYNNGWAEAAAGGGWTASSDKRFKENVVELTNITNALKNIRGVRFNWKTKEFPQKGFPEGTQIGFIAQEVEKEFPELVMTDPDGYKSMDYGKLTPVLLEAIKEQQVEIESLEERIEALEKR